MQVFKFGGASIKEAKAVKNVSNIIKTYGVKPLVIVVSAMGKTTQALEELLKAHGSSSFQQKLQNIKTFHLNICKELFNENHAVFNLIEKEFILLEKIDFEQQNQILLHAQVVSVGEITSSLIINNYLNYIGIDSSWLYAPEVVKTKRQYSEGEVLWNETSDKIKQQLLPILSKKVVVTQGYIASCDEGIITLGKEGSDFTAAIFASCLKADKVTIWKDVPGILNADPKEINNPTQIFELHYKEASEMTYYGASVIHPKTIKPLALNAIPLEVRSFDSPLAKPTVISNNNNSVLEPSIIYKNNQCLFSFKVLDYTFVDEENMATIFKVLHQLNLPINMMQNSAISISVCFNYEEQKVKKLLELLNHKFTMYYNSGLKLITIKNYTQEMLEKYSPNSEHIFLEQKSRNNYRALIKGEVVD